MAIRVLIADDHSLLRECLRNALDEAEDLLVVSEVRSGRQAEKEALTLKPDVILLDLDLPGSGGIEFARSMKRSLPGTAILLLTVETDRKRLLEAVRAGAEGYVLTDIDSQTLVEAIRGVCRLRRACRSENAAKVIFEMDGVLAAERDTLSFGVPTSAPKLSRSSETIRRPEEGRLTSRELEVLLTMSQGMTNAQIARKLYISEKTVKNHATRIFRKLGAKSRVDAVRRATIMGLLEKSGDS